MGQTDDNPLARDLDHVLDHTRELWEQVRGQRVFVTGGTGFFGCWLLESFAWANRRLDLRARMTVLSRRPDAFAAKAPHLAADAAITFQAGDVRDFEFPDGDFPFVVHAATDTGATLYADAPLVMLDTIIEGTRRMLEFAAARGGAKLLLTSSGAIYGRQPPELSHMPEVFAGGPDPLAAGSIYGEGKRACETLCAAFCRGRALEAKVARCYAVVGPYMPLDAQFAAGNFIRDALAGGPIVVSSDGRPLRSYLYAADEAIWLWTILFKGRTLVAYNVGSDQAVSIAEVALAASKAVPSRPAVKISLPPQSGPAPRYVPSIERARTELGLQPWVELQDAMCRTAWWFGDRGVARPSWP